MKVKAAGAATLTIHLHLMSNLRMDGAILLPAFLPICLGLFLCPPPSPYVLMVRCLFKNSNKSVSAVGIATRYGLDGPGIESRWGRDFPHPSRPAMGPTQSPTQWVPGLSRGKAAGAWL